MGIRKIRPFVSFRPRAREIGIRRFNFQLFPTLYYSLDNRLLDYSIFTAPINFRTESQEHIEFNYNPEQVTLEEPFEIRDGVTIPPGRYKWTRYRVMVNTATKRPWVVQAAYWWGSKPGNDLFVVINRGWEDIDDRFRSAFDRGTVKFQYTFRL